MPRTSEYPTINLNPRLSAPYDHNSRPSHTDGRTDKWTNIMAIGRFPGLKVEMTAHGVRMVCEPILGSHPGTKRLMGIRQAKASKAENIVMFNYLFFLPSMHILQHFVVVQGDSNSPVQRCRAGLTILVRRVGSICTTVPQSEICGGRVPYPPNAVLMYTTKFVEADLDSSLFGRECHAKDDQQLPRDLSALPCEVD